MSQTTSLIDKNQATLYYSRYPCFWHECVTLTSKWLVSLSKNGRVVNVHMFIRSAIEFAGTNLKQSFVRFWVTTCLVNSSNTCSTLSSCIVLSLGFILLKILCCYELKIIIYCIGACTCRYQ